MYTNYGRVVRDILCQGLDIDNDEEVESTNLTSFIQLCESTQKRIVQSKEPVSWKEIEELLGTIEGKLIQDAMLEEVKWMIEKGKVVPENKHNMPVGAKEMDGKWVIKYKKTLSGLLDRVRARWVLRGDKQRPYRDYNPDNVYSPVASKTSVLTALIIAVQHGLELYCIDISKAFTVSPLDTTHAPK